MPSARAQLALDVGQHRERQVAQVLVVDAPGVVHELAVGAGAEHLGVAVGELPFSLPKAAISVGHTKVKSFGQKNTTSHLPS